MTSHSNFQFLPVPKSTRCTILKKNMATSLSSNVNSRRATNTLYVMMIIQKLLLPICSTLDDIACFLSCRRENLNIVGADKGEVIGNLCYTMEGDRIECFKRSQLHFFDRIPCILVTAKGYPDVTTRRCF
ncbi:spo11/DNA topoisomerase VI, subunit A, putative [Medicago truncatula]|uniref:Spo11/DNA topoisomerase VI, subunit A, putative n=1 Tax=Medicago truncatula TaxID=3880 RepID=G7L241_MEDTR|nr:spo11/DNA topoisomerase VI, subunit A, putative [Medicago truncatula]